MIERSGACDSSDFHCDTILGGSDDIGYNHYVYFKGFEIIKLSIENKNVGFISLIGIATI